MKFLETVIALIILRCEGYLEQIGVKGGLAKYPSLSLFVSRLSDEALEEWRRSSMPEEEAGESSRSGISSVNGGEKQIVQTKRYGRILRLLGGSTVLQSFLDLELALYSFPEFGAYLTEHFGYSVNLHLACLLEGEAFPAADEIAEYYALAEKLCYADRTAAPRQYAELVMDERALGFLFGSDELSPLLSDFTTLFDPEAEEIHGAFVHKELVAEGIAFFKNPAGACGTGKSIGETGGLKQPLRETGGPKQALKGGGDLKQALREADVAYGEKALQLSGNGGRRFLAKQIAKGLSKPFLFLSISDFFREAGKDRVEELRSALIREAVFDNAGICFYGITEHFLTDGGEDGSRLKRDLEVLKRIVFKPILKEGIPLILCADTGRALLSSLPAGSFLLIELPHETDYESRRRLWEGFASIHGLSLDAERFAMRYRLNASEISAMILSFMERRPKQAPDGDDKEYSEGNLIQIGAKEEALFAKLCIQRAEAEDGKNIGRVTYPSLLLDDVKVKPQVRSILNDAVTGIRKSPVVLDTWGLRKNYPYGRSVSVLLSGPPGTGKTMTANAIAGELSLPLYQVNLSSIMDKYIGETEKNLEKAFLFAEKTDAVLFFDEADALFGARSEVHDAKDRYANTEISYLLQRIEAYDGIVVMATNIMANIDPAFLRRIRYVIRYENPDEGLRREIWEGCLTEGLPHEEIDLDYLASQFESFTGSIIKTVFLNACAYAAGRGEVLGMAHLVHSIRQELEKTSAVGFKGDMLGKYVHLA